jgi:hypothetical protein
MRLRRLLRASFLISISVTLPTAFNACGGQFMANHPGGSNSLASMRSLTFNRVSIAEFTKDSSTLSGSCFAGQSLSIQVEAQPMEVVACSSGAFSHTVHLPGADGPKTIVASTQYGGQSYMDSITITKDTIVPGTSIINAASSGNFIVVSGACEDGLPLSFGGDILSMGAVTCANGIFQASVSVKAAAGPYNLRISQTDKAGNTGTGTMAYTPDTSAPALVINSPAANAYVKASMQVAGLCETGLNVKVTSAALAQALDLPCTNGTFSSMVTVDGNDGAKTFTFSQTDSANNKTEKVVAVTKDTVVPMLTVAQPATGATFTTDTVVVSGTCESGLPVSVQGSGLSASVTALCASAAFSTAAVFSSGNGNKTIDIVQADQAGNQAKVSRTVMKSAPLNNLAITQPTADFSTNGNLTLAGTCDTGATVSFSGGIQTASNVSCVNGAFTRALTLSSGDGMKTVNVSQALNGVTSSTSRNFVLDTKAPALTIVNPAANATVKGNFTVSGTCETGLQVTLSGSGLSASGTATCTAGAFSTVISASAGDGAKTFTTAQTDAAGNSGSVSRTVNRMTNTTLLTIVQPVTGDNVRNTATVSGACESGITVNLSGSITAVNAACASGLYSQTVTFTSGDGQKTINAKQTDSSNNVSSASVSVTKDTVAPVLTIASPAADTKSATGLTVLGTCETGLTVKASGTGVASEVSAPCVAQNYSVNIVFSGADGNKTVTISSTDSAGNMTSVSRQFVKGTTDLLPQAKAVLDQYCVRCHGPGGQAAYADFTLTTSQAFIDSGWVVAGEIDKSKLIYRMVHYSGPTGGVARNMPLNATGTFPVSAYDTLVAWVQQMPTTTVTPPPAPSFACEDPNAQPMSLSYTLTKDQYQNSITDLFGANALTGLSEVLSTLPRDTFDPTSNQRTSTLSTEKIEAYFNLAKGIAANVTANSTMLTTVFGSCAATTTPAATCIDTYIAGFAKKIFRRPLTTDEATYARSIANRGGDYKANLRTLLSLHLQAPAFIWRLETGNASQSSSTLLQLTPYEVATRISYMTTDSAPDAQLMQAADSGQLSTLTQVQAQVKRLMQTQRGKNKARANLLRYGRADKAEDLSTLPTELKQGVQTDGLSQAMVDEAAAYVDYSLYTQNASFKTLLTSKASFASHPGLASIYGHAPITGSTPATFPDRRQGLLMRAPFLAGNRLRTKLILRGVYFQKFALCNEIPPPSSVVADLREAQVFSPEELLNHTTREAIAYQTSQPVCMTCHTTINPTGFAFENFDPFGRIRVSEAIFDSTGKFVRTLPVDTNATVPIGSNQVPVSDAYDLVSYLATSPDGAACFTKQAYRYLNEKRESADDGCELDKVHKIVMDPTKPVLDALTELIANNSLFVKRK